VKAYIDSGVFIDYLIGRGHAGSYLRAVERRGRPPERLRADAEGCLAVILQRHAGLTSSLTCYEVEEALYRELRRASAGVPTADSYLVPSARAAVIQTLVTIKEFKIALVDLTSAVVDAHCGNLELQKRGIRAADALHVTTAIAEGAQVLITTDTDLIRLDNVFETRGGSRLRCVDTDQAIALLA
jgi:predicted nucleic acid-binding protein